jgi:type 1 fimbria pilin
MQYAYKTRLHLPFLFQLIIVIGWLFPAGISHAYDGEVTVSGKITANTCTVSTNDMTVDMGKVDSQVFINGTTKGLPSTPFTINLKGCNGIAPGVSVGFFGKPDPNKPDIYALAKGGATGIGIQLMDKDKLQIPVNTLSKSYPLDATATDIALQFYALYTANGTAVQAGRADTTVAFKLVYD